MAAPIDLLIYRTNTLHTECQQRILESGSYDAAVRNGWSDGLRVVFSDLPSPDWC